MAPALPLSFEREPISCFCVLDCPDSLSSSWAVLLVVFAIVFAQMVLIFGAPLAAIFAIAISMLLA